MIAVVFTVTHHDAKPNDKPLVFWENPFGYGGLLKPRDVVTQYKPIDLPDKLSYYKTLVGYLTIADEQCRPCRVTTGRRCRRLTIKDWYGKLICTRKLDPYETYLV